MNQQNSTHWTDLRYPRYDSPASKEVGFDGSDSTGATAAPHKDSGFSFSNTMLRGGMAPVMTGLCGASKGAPVPVPGPSTRTALSPILDGMGDGESTVRTGATMANTAIEIATPDLAIIEGQITTTSQQVAQHFGKRHADVIRAIRMLDAPAEFNERNFALVETTDAKGEKRPAYRITRDGFTLLAMGFTGKEAMQWKVAYLNAFNQMEAQLLAMTHPALPSTISEQQCQHLQELVQLVVQSGKQTHGETWKRFHNKMKVASYRNLPAERFNDAVTYLKGKLDDETMLDLVAKHLAERMPAALEMAMVAASGVFTETVRQVLTAQDSPSMIRLMVGAQHVPGKGLQPMAHTVRHDQCLMSFNEMTKAVNEPGGLRLSNADLFGMLGAVTTKLSDRNADQQARLAA